eukprot:CAMPEP_0202909216 /NCGR_PEP_ID=MMETSP1392-20130828/48680_1 /ASSEMBLY_ACC=CAM_ASM_000868 /TAXON_ID=225041 /ORGANISM="Chlamydomonas chlamydogama, Strain SAG 11-48b" /LENGTH=573 /DNA_ID=CAMNT_0049598897 /DNA_START=38 /DNA_END=1760 /DNA_ORIENTATION=+
MPKAPAPISSQLAFQQYHGQQYSRATASTNSALSSYSKSHLASVAADPMTDLETWVTESGGVVSGVRLSVVHDRQRGLTKRDLRATQDLPAGQLLLSIPRPCQLRYDDVDDPRLTALFDKLPRGSGASGGPAWQFKQALVLLWHLSRGTSSPLHTHIASLPGVAEGVPVPRIGMLLHEEAVQQLQYAPLIEDINNHKYWLKQFSAEVLVGLPGSAEDPFEGMPVDQNLFAWAVAVVISRSFCLRRTSAHVMPALIDMVDHDPQGANCEVSSQEDGALHMVTRTQVSKGEALRLSYGPHDNHHLLLSYGFVLQPTNPTDKLYFDFDAQGLMAALAPPAQTPPGLHAWQRSLMQRLGLLPSDPQPADWEQTSPELNPRVYIGNMAATASPQQQQQQQAVDLRLVAAVRGLTLQDEFSLSLVRNRTLSELGDCSVPLSRQHEVAVLQVLVDLCTALYRSFGSTIQQDKAVLQQLEEAQRSAAAGSTGSTSSTSSTGAAPAVLTGSSGRPVVQGKWSEAQRLALSGRLAQLQTDAATQVAELVMAVQYRLGLKLALEEALKGVLARKRELEDLQQVK